MADKIHKSGFVNILGNPNVGKSTLMNALVGEKISIITSKAQTTRHRILGIVSGEDFQIVYSDTPGILDPKYKLQESMVKGIHTAFIDADIILYVTDVKETFDKHAQYLEKLQNTDIPVLLLINKIDLSSQTELENLVTIWHEKLPNARIIPLSALEKFNIDSLINQILKLLPEGPAYYDKSELTDKTERFIVEEIVREKILVNYEKEIPYSAEVKVESFKEEKDIIRISAIIYVMRDSQKGIIIGKGGELIKKVGTQARKDIEYFFGKKVFIELFVKIKKDWRDNTNFLKQFGYEI